MSGFRDFRVEPAFRLASTSFFPTASRRHNWLFADFFSGLFSRANQPFIFLPEPASAGDTMFGLAHPQR